MALSNIFREPRREIIESVVGTIAVGAFLYLDWKFACWFQSQAVPEEKGFRIIGVMAGIVVITVIYGLIKFAHWVGEGICELLEGHGLKLRPYPRERGY
jgi:hypothetical protein